MPPPAAFPGKDGARRPALDGVRGLAIGLVLLCHAGVLPIGWAGVDLFFALSGFLITGVLLRTRSRPDYWTRFASRRVRRILPLYLVVLAVVWAVRAAGLDPSPTAPWWAFLTFTANVWFSLYGYGSPLLEATWSLCVEEQFYVVWPSIVRVAPRWVLGALAVAAIVGCPVLRSSVDPHSAYLLTACRLDALAAGVLGALLVGRGWAQPLALLAVVAGGAVLALASAAGLSALVYTGVAGVAGGLVYLAGELDPGWLALAPLRWLGRVSYGLYLLHGPLVVWLGPAAGILVAGALAELSWRYLEAPINGAGRTA